MAGRVEEALELWLVALHHLETSHGNRAFQKQCIIILHSAVHVYGVFKACMKTKSQTLPW